MKLSYFQIHLVIFVYTYGTGLSPPTNIEVRHIGYCAHSVIVTRNYFRNEQNRNFPKFWSNPKIYY